MYICTLWYVKLCYHSVYILHMVLPKVVVVSAREAHHTKTRKVKLVCDTVNVTKKASSSDLCISCYISHETTDRFNSQTHSVLCMADCHPAEVEHTWSRHSFNAFQSSEDLERSQRIHPSAGLHQFTRPVPHLHSLLSHKPQPHPTPPHAIAIDLSAHINEPFIHCVCLGRTFYKCLCNCTHISNVDKMQPVWDSANSSQPQKSLSNNRSLNTYRTCDRRHSAHYTFACLQIL